MKKLLGIILMATGLAVAAPASYAQVSVGISVNTPPPELPVYEQPVCPADGYIWTPGYWAYGDDGYYWVPGVWVAPPSFGVYWTPAWWGFDGGVYAFHSGYWGPHVGFYGGINYGFGYGGSGYYGGRWNGNRFAYNTAVTRVNRTFIHNTYVNNTFVRNNNHYSFNGRGGAMARPTREEEMAAHDRHINPTSNQLAHQRNASHDRSQFASVNHGRPAVTAMNKVNGRRFNQQGRIAKGVSSGRLTAGEIKHLENREGNINKTVRTDRAKNNGRLTAQEHRNINTGQNSVSRSIHTDKHNANNDMERSQRSAQKTANNERAQQRNVNHNMEQHQMSHGPSGGGMHEMPHGGGEHAGGEHHR